jgi:hypothetical protein
VCGYVSAKAVDNLTKNANVVDLLEKHLVTIFGPVMEYIRASLQESDARSWAIKLGVALVRAALGK